MRNLLILLGLLAVAAAPASAGKAPKVSLAGFWDTPGGRVEIKLKGTKATGVLTSPIDGLKVAAGTVVLDGTFFDDNLSADIRVGVLVPECGADAAKAFAMLLMTKKGKLTGGISTRAKCARSLSSVTIPRAEDQTSGAGEKHVMVGPAAPDGTYDPRGHRTGDLPATVRGMMEKAAAFFETGEWEKARDIFLKVVEKDPKVGEAYNGIGVSYSSRQNFTEAIDWYKKGLEAAPGFGDIYYNLACAYAQSEKKSMALRYLRLAVLKGYTELEYLDTDPDLEPVRGEPEFKEIRALAEAPPPPIPE